MDSFGCICIDCLIKNECQEYQKSIVSNKAYYEWICKVSKCEKEREELEYADSD